MSYHAGALITIIAFFLGCTLPATESVKILAMESVGGLSHWNFMRAVLRVLTDAGHTVTVFTPFPEGDRKNYTEVDMSEVFLMKLDLNVTYIFEHFPHPTLQIVPMTTNLSRIHCDAIYENDVMQTILSRGPSLAAASDFDLIIAEPLGSDCVSYVASVLRLPLIYVVPSPMITHLERDFLGHIPNPATVSHMLADHGVPTSFVQRFSNVALLAYTMLVSDCTRRWLVYAIGSKPYDLVPAVQPSAIFVNSHFITEPSRPMLPNVVSVGGVHLNKPCQECIPRDILEFIEKSPTDVIYFNFGSVVKMSTLMDNIKKTFKEALALVPYRVLWKYEDEMEDIPQNVMIRKWLPQRDILLHPKVKLFISHGGISGIYETVDAAVPVLGFSFFYDQRRNLDNLVNAGMAITIDLHYLSKDSFVNSVLELMSDEKYSKNAKIASERFKDRPMSPEKLIVYWTEYIHRHKGAPHLKSQALNLAFYQYLLLDVIAAIFVLICIIWLISYNIFKMIYKYCLMHKTNTSQNVKTKSE